jgi:hypothetical protein
VPTRKYKNLFATKGEYSNIEFKDEVKKTLKNNMHSIISHQVDINRVTCGNNVNKVTS